MRKKLERAFACLAAGAALLSAASANAGPFSSVFVFGDSLSDNGNLAEIQLYAALRDRGELTVRTRTSFGAVAVNHHLTPEFLADLEKARNLYHDDWVSANLVKLFVDGGTGLVPPQTAVGGWSRLNGRWFAEQEDPAHIDVNGERRDSGPYDRDDAQHDHDHALGNKQAPIAAHRVLDCAFAVA